MAPRRVTQEKAARIAEMFAAGVGLDRVSEEGVLNGWTRDQARQVVADNGWALDWSGRIQKRYRVFRPHVDDGDDDSRQMIAAALDHELVDIRRMAREAERALDDLRRALILQEQIDAEEVVRRRAGEDLAAAERADPKNWVHGEWASYIKHKRHDVPMCDACAAVGLTRMRENRDIRLTRSHHKRRQPAEVA